MAPPSSDRDRLPDAVGRWPALRRCARLSVDLCWSWFSSKQGGDRKAGRERVDRAVHGAERATSKPERRLGYRRLNQVPLENAIPCRALGNSDALGDITDVGPSLIRHAPWGQNLPSPTDTRYKNSN